VLVLGVLVAGHMVEASQLVPMASRVRAVDVGVLGSLPVTDGRSLLERQLGGLLDDGDRLPDRFVSTRTDIASLVATARTVAMAHSEVPVVVLRVPADPLVNVNSLLLEDRLAHPAPRLITGALGAPLGFTSEELDRLLTDPARGLPNFVLTLPPYRRTSESLDHHLALLRALDDQGFDPAAEAMLADGRLVSLWFRPQSEAVEAGRDR
jgi:hypothetical protein